MVRKILFCDLETWIAVENYIVEWKCMNMYEIYLNDLIADMVAFPTKFERCFMDSKVIYIHKSIV